MCDRDDGTGAVLNLSAAGGNDVKYMRATDFLELSSSTRPCTAYMTFARRTSEHRNETSGYSDRFAVVLSHGRTRRGAKLF